MEEKIPGDVREELLSAIEQKRSPTIDWVIYERADLPENWKLYLQVAQELQKQGVIELQATFTSFEIRRKSGVN